MDSQAEGVAPDDSQPICGWLAMAYTGGCSTSGHSGFDFDKEPASAHDAEAPPAPLFALILPGSGCNAALSGRGRVRFGGASSRGGPRIGLFLSLQGDEVFRSARCRTVVKSV